MASRLGIRVRMEQSIEVKTLIDDYQLIDFSLKRIMGIKKGVSADWYKFIDRQHTKIYYRKETGKTLYTFYFEKYVEAPIFSLISILNECQTFKDWVPLMYASNILHEPSPFRKLGEFAASLPWPFSNRSIYMTILAVEAVGDNAIIVVMKSVQGNVWLKDKHVQKDPNCVETIIHFTSLYLEQISESKSIMRIISNLDPQLGMLPQWLMNQSIKGVALVFLNQIQKKAQNLEEVYKKLIEEKPAMYRQVGQRLKRQGLKSRIKELGAQELGKLEVLIGKVDSEEEVGEDGQSRVIVVQASSSGYGGRQPSRITINDVAVPINTNTNNHHRGLHIVLINPSTGSVDSAQCFDTHKTSSALDAFTSRQIPEGCIVAVTCSDDCVSQLSSSARSWFESMGSSEISKLQYRHAFAFIGMNGKQDAQEKRAFRLEDEVSVSRVFVL